MSSVHIGQVSKQFTASGRFSKYQVELTHSGLKAHRVLSDKSQSILQNKVIALLARWDEQWTQRQKVANERAAREKKRATREEAKANAEHETRAALAALQACHEVLTHTLRVNDRVDWESLKNHREFRRDPGTAKSVVYSAITGEPTGITPSTRPMEPLETADVYRPQIGILDRLLGRSARRRAEAAARFAADRDRWEEASRRCEVQDAAAQALLIEEGKEWRRARAEYETTRDAANAEVDAMRATYLSGASVDAIEEHAELVLDSSVYPDWHQISFELAYNPETKTLVVDYDLPTRGALPTLREVTYVASRDDTREKHINARDLDALFDSVCYQITLRTLHELFEADEAQAHDAIVFNGWVEDVNPATGRTERACILSVQAQRDEFGPINLASVDPKACFRQLKGVAAAKLAGLAPVAPILQFDSNDRRFVEGREVAGNLDASANLAAMPWEDFEHLIRELFQKEFSDSGEVRVTQASRDGGVDAIAYDPDPIRGGKVVIQAKRYTNTVGVSAVRDLYGTVLNEGANKGILVTTSDYGPDAYGFAKDKPLVLLSGSNLLSLLEKHGYSARIDLKEARDQR